MEIRFLLDVGKKIGVEWCVSKAVGHIFPSETKNLNSTAAVSFGKYIHDFFPL